jgi:thiamine phosphate synthase YjbQ (UPF0047 family)
MRGRLRQKSTAILTGEDNAAAHLKRQIMDREVVVAITKGKLDFGGVELVSSRYRFKLRHWFSVVS